MNIDVAQDIGDREFQEDRWVVLSTKDGFAGHVLDGHGGSDCVDVVSKCLENDILPQFDVEQENSEIVRGLQMMTGMYEKQGTTISSVYCFKDHAYASVLGDSPIWVIQDGTIKQLPVHDISNKEEFEKRLEAGMILKPDYPKHLWDDQKNGLSTFRSIGDNVFGDKLGREPEFYNLGKDFDAIIVASDGLKLKDKDILKKYKKGAKELVKLNKDYLFGNELDNVTIIIYSN